MALYPQTGSSLGAAGGQDNTNVALSTMILIKVGLVAVGAVQTLQINEARTVTMVNEVGTDGSIDSAPTASAKFSGTINRIRFDRKRATEALGRDFLHVHSQRIPFDIDIYDRWSGDGANTIITTIKNVWITAIGYSYSVSDWMVTDNITWEAETMFSTLNGGSAATGGTSGPSTLQINTVEIAADTGNRRGSMDAPGLITDFFSSI